eukprot:CAMPEP_0171958802 /NCGR_PEP_ID=MMETSP0993-20121228/142668_1 /TAXON_ID=483369 /ORGANISM="non described non described, Strain CCMP2098" /LENGTH=33 /DNA_ID= /DNA_START= /DNA_END= /DNA_ORIENTATION=
MAADNGHTEVVRLLENGGAAVKGKPAKNKWHWG